MEKKSYPLAGMYVAARISLTDHLLYAVKHEKDDRKTELRFNIRVEFEEIKEK